MDYFECGIICRNNIPKTPKRFDFNLKSANLEVILVAIWDT